MSSSCLPLTSQWDYCGGLIKPAQLGSFARGRRRMFSDISRVCPGDLCIVPARISRRPAAATRLCLVYRGSPQNRTLRARLLSSGARALQLEFYLLKASPLLWLC